MVKIRWKAEKRKISELQPYSKNPRVFTEKGMEDLHKSIDEIGNVDIKELDNELMEVNNG